MIGGPDTATGPGTMIAGDAEAVRLIDMDENAHLAGFFAAHGIWSICDGAQLTPILGHQNADGSFGLDRFSADDLTSGARAGYDALQGNRPGAVRAVLVVDGYAQLDSGRLDALIIDAVEYGEPRCWLKIVVPYRRHSDPRGFAVHRPKFVEVVGSGKPDYKALGGAFFAGVEAHELASLVWGERLDSSI